MISEVSRSHSFFKIIPSIVLRHPMSPCECRNAEYGGSVMRTLPQYIIVPRVRRKFVIIWFKVGFVPTSCSQRLILLICRFIFVVLPSLLHDKMCLQVSVCVVQLGHLLPKCKWSFCFERFLRTAATLKTCFPTKSWNIFGNLCSVVYTDSQSISLNWSGLRVPSLL